ncbi:MAG: prephenate dehydratase [Candidatus Thiodiazotropha lotti]|uniref:Bifunctional chorismate mutase/prephenate dehydratase n=1 Tax=Candidatus Thiodiazotropha lotti TaxID=2792787 RepID=A0A9E4K2B4_9GAMM|nr:prephenate dehydratase [Candidatus Thiodiazotropha lotti]ODB94791.1 chorismate mutase [Candidatus Thiodiazotropha endoloripes]MCG7922950.1 prephenate dehydratase [Candidatus Thiodiazotropha lotti]MCG7930441.1 prephenate dehydratase [Candidatus Thiodiazotropha lotti]MCG7937719.1 prephenate dehydratase [Candidatus Thiodiazotropha lotti]
MNDDAKLKSIRQRIDEIDSQLQALINERAEAAQEVARIKLSANPEAEFYRPEREAAVLRKVKDRNQGPLESEEVARLFREIMSACLALEKPLNVAFLGPDGTFTQAAALKQFGHSVRTHSLNSIGDIFRDVEAGACQYGVVPVENSTEGVISHTLDSFLNSPLLISGEVTLRINHQLLSKEKERASVQKVYSHAQSLAQCRGWLDRHLPNAERIAVNSNAEAAGLASQQSGSAAIAGDAAGEIYQLNQLATNIEDEPGNTTRFLVIGKQDVAASGMDKTTILFSTHNKAGGLHEMLSPFAEHGISMTRIESRPSRRGRWDYVFFVDVEGHKDDHNLSQALKKIEQSATQFRVLGSYPKAVL